ncbi:hypothetical protein C9F11_43540 (plasmid) [Streptomyces sp. YIM 121038]|uniref:restriction endonuclease n=1 Tax=Streptomyces sp. YIM 121038 TaxID=2136401 RepID=UPI0011104E60|nr:restriction endonuclease [Streptomyces sp. YIM 121038]QCX82286.1 hypothetical protein C9F11_43540 [Streptomyces sp. YIM 121038]
MNTARAGVDGPPGLLGAEPPLGRKTCEGLLKAVLAWSDPGALRPGDYHQVGLLLAGAGQAVAADVRAYAARLPDDDSRRPLAEIVLGEADRRLWLAARSLHDVRNKARMVRALYERLDRLAEAAPAAVSP